jgi:hypothetical protein
MLVCSSVNVAARRAALATNPFNQTKIFNYRDSVNCTVTYDFGGMGHTTPFYQSVTSLPRQRHAKSFILQINPVYLINLPYKGTGKVRALFARFLSAEARDGATGFSETR